MEVKFYISYTLESVIKIFLLKIILINDTIYIDNIIEKLILIILK